MRIADCRDPKPIAADYVHLSKFKSKDDEGYKSVVKAIKSIAQENSMEETPVNPILTCF